MRCQVNPEVEKLQVEDKTLKAVARGAIAGADLWLGECPLPPDSSIEPTDVDTWAVHNKREGSLVAALGHVGYTDVDPRLPHWREAGRRVVMAAIHYFFGDWRKREFTWLSYRLNEASARTFLEWTSLYRPGIAKAAIFEQWSDFDQLLTWPGDDLSELHEDGTVDDRHREDLSYQIWLAARLLGKDSASVAHHRTRIERGARKRPKLQLAVADALLGGDEKGFERDMVKYLTYYRKTEFRPNRIDFLIADDANVLWHVARRRGLALPLLAPELKLFIVDADDLEKQS